MNHANRTTTAGAVAAVNVFATSLLLAEEPRLRDTFRGDNQRVSSLVFSLDGKRLAPNAVPLSFSATVCSFQRENSGDCDRSKAKKRMNLWYARGPTERG